MKKFAILYLILIVPLAFSGCTNDTNQIINNSKNTQVASVASQNKTTDLTETQNTDAASSLDKQQKTSTTIKATAANPRDTSSNSLSKQKVSVSTNTTKISSSSSASKADVSSTSSKTQSTSVTSTASNSKASTGSASTSPGNTSSTSIPSPTPKPVVVGIDTTLTAQLRQYIVEGTITYHGIQTDTFNNIANEVALSKMSTSEAMSTIQIMTWQEEGTNISPYDPAGIHKINIGIVKCTKFNEPGNKTAYDIATSDNSKFNLGEYDNVIAYRNSDNTITITSLSVGFLVFNN